ncbi:uncharacterized protein LOC123555599 [Mercenaria mercenaria]|uniref:uncharacterized protein LOC123555599 n=1 Tax=Mercenaria mercenaria TaxID=6596 RepID=UPI00234F6ADA|nr:uncharacterized protein LOC123555599 [Mercenaria mercenaria]
MNPRYISAFLSDLCQMGDLNGHSRIISLLVGLCLCVVSVKAGPPCFASDYLEPLRYASLRKHIDKIVSETDGLLMKANDLKEYIGGRFLLSDEYLCSGIPLELLSERGLAFPAYDDSSCPIAFIHIPSVSDDERVQDYLTEICDPSSRKTARTAHILWIMRTTYNILNVLANYFEHLKYSTKESPTVERNITFFQREIYSSMCTIKIALRSQDVDLPEAVPSGHLSAHFLQHYMSTRTERQFTTYVTVRDSVRIANYINEIYQSIQDCYLNLDTYIYNLLT